MTKYSDNSTFYDETWDEWESMKKYGPASRWLRYLIKEIIENINNGSIKSVIDIGCGEGSNTIFLSELFPNAKIVGTDFSKKAIQLAKLKNSNKNVGFYHDNCKEFLQKKYDLVTCFEVLEHVDDWKNFLLNIFNLSSNYILLSFPTGKMRPFEINVGHLRNFKKGEIEVFMQANNISIITVYYAGFPFYSPIYRNICNFFNAGSNDFTHGKYNYLKKFLSSAIFVSFKCFSSKNNFGEQFIGLFKKKGKVQNKI